MPRVEMCCVKICKSQMGTFCPREEAQRQKHSRDMGVHARSAARMTWVFFFFNVFIYLSVLGPSCIMWNLPHIM